MIPADERFDALDATVRGARLEVDRAVGFARRDRPAQLVLEHQTVTGEGVHGGRVELKTIAASALGLVHGHVRVLEERLAIGAVTRIEG